MPFGGAGLCCCCCFCVILQNICYSHKLPKHYLCNKFVIQIVFRKFLTMILFGLLITTEIQYDKSLENIRCFPLQKASRSLDRIKYIQKKSEDFVTNIYMSATHSQKRLGRPDSKIMALADTSMVRLYRSATQNCSGVYLTVRWRRMPPPERYFSKSLPTYSPPLSLPS